METQYQPFCLNCQVIFLEIVHFSWEKVWWSRYFPSLLPVHYHITSIIMTVCLIIAHSTVYLIIAQSYKYLFSFCVARLPWFWKEVVLKKTSSAYSCVLLPLCLSVPSQSWSVLTIIIQVSIIILVLLMTKRKKLHWSVCAHLTHMKSISKTKFLHTWMWRTRTSQHSCAIFWTEQVCFVVCARLGWDQPYWTTPILAWSAVAMAGWSKLQLNSYQPHFSS